MALVHYFSHITLSQSRLLAPFEWKPLSERIDFLFDLTLKELTQIQKMKEHFSQGPGTARARARANSRAT